FATGQGTSGGFLGARAVDVSKLQSTWVQSRGVAAFVFFPAICREFVKDCSWKQALAICWLMTNLVCILSRSGMVPKRSCSRMGVTCLTLFGAWPQNIPLFFMTSVTEDDPSQSRTPEVENLQS